MKKILLVGSSGFIGKHTKDSLGEYDVTMASRNEKDGLALDYGSMPTDEKLTELLKGFDIIINAVGIIAEEKRQSFEQLHTKAPMQLFRCAKLAGVKRVIQISALGSQTGTTPYHTSKDKADNYLKSLGLEYIILRPSVVYGDDGKSTALFWALASLPITPIIGDGSQKLQPIHINDLTNTIKASIETKESSLEINLVGEKEISYKELLHGYQKWLGHSKKATISLPDIGTDVIGKILDEPTVSSANIKMLNEGNSASVDKLSQFLGYTPKCIQDKLFKRRANHAQKLYSSLYFLRPLLRLVIGFVWIWSGIVSAFLFPQEDALRLLHDIGISSPLDIPMLYIASFLDIMLGILTIVGYNIKRLYMFQIVVIAVYTILLSLLAPYHWLHPFGPVLKNIPLVLTLYTAMMLERYR